MEEKIIEARFKKNILALVLITVSLVAIVIGCIITYNDYRNGNDFYAADNGIFYTDDRESGFYPNSELYDSFGDYFKRNDNPFDNLYLLGIYCGFLGVLLGLFMIWLMNSCAMTITNSRVIGKASFGKRVDLPMNQISAISLGLCGSIVVATSSGKIHFWLLENRDKVHAELAKVIRKVQVERTTNNSNVSTPNSADELRKYKELLDSGVITQEEFNAKKKQLLNL